MSSDRLYIERRHNPELQSQGSLKFAPKLTFEQRCFALLLAIEGASWPNVAKFYGVHRRTVETIETGPAYKNVRDSFNRLGLDKFKKEFWNEEWYEAFKKYLADKDNTVLGSSTAKQTTDPDAANWHPNKGATAKNGTHRVLDGTTKEQRTVVIEFRGALAGVKPGWYWSVKDHGESGRPYATSQEAWDASRIVWDYNSSHAAKEQEKREQAKTAIIERAILARAAMEANTNQTTVDAFVAAFIAAQRAATNCGEEFAREMLENPANWRGIDPTPFGYTVIDEKED